MQAENLDRNVNIFRQLIHPHGPPFSKPRFVLTGEEMHLVNSPAIPPERLLDAFELFDSHPLARHEAYYRSRDYASQWWAGSRLAGFVYEFFSRRSEEARIAYGLDSERGGLGKAIVDAFANDVRQRGKAFLIAFLPHQEYFIRWYWGAEIPYRSLLQHFREAYHYLDFADQLTPEHMDGRHWGATLHYGPELNRALADFVASEILVCLENGTCPLPSF